MAHILNHAQKFLRTKIPFRDLKKLMMNNWETLDYKIVANGLLLTND
jgi:hypothetical protein